MANMINCHRGTKGLHRRCPRSERHRAPALNYEYDPATDKWTEKKRDAAVGPPCCLSRCQREDLCDRPVSCLQRTPRSRPAARGNPSPTRWSTIRRPPPEDHGNGLLNGFQALAQETGVPVPKLDVVLVMLCST
jgi:hypothetical protein